MNLWLVALLPSVAVGLLYVTGGISETTMSPTEEPVVFAVKAINEQLAAGDGHIHNLGLVNIVNSRKQVVAGYKYFLTLHMTEGYYCNVTVWFRDWIYTADRLQVLDGPTCTKHHQSASARALGSMPGGVSPRRPVNGADVEAEVRDALNFSACASNDRSNNMYAVVLGDVSRVTYTQQVTAGMTYRFYNVPLVETNCLNKGCAHLDFNECTASDHARAVATCFLTVQYQPWMKPPMNLISMECGAPLPRTGRTGQVAMGPH